ncbi:MAG TPA: TonB-dependent receptor plug domain-containing protein [Bacteroidales bacterium]|nr:TonB-dependent receptor plug domain-containing protein [Bacteroidales bacterium]
MKKRIFFAGSLVLALVIVLFSSFISIQPSDSNIVKSLVFKLTAFYNWYPQQKVYLHLDKDQYNADERIWFKAYVVNATNHHPDSLSTNLYVDLVNPNGYVVQTVLLKLQDGFANGGFGLQDTVPEGNYRILAYTNWMRNAGDGFFFSKNLYISNPRFKIYATPEEVKTIKHSRRKNIRLAQKFDVSFLPEGGNLLNGVENRVAFKAINELGYPIDISGRLLDKKGNEILTFNSVHDGMGAFSFTPQPGMDYVAQIKSGQSNEKKFRLPEGIDKGIVLKADYAGMDSVRVTIVTNMGTGSMPVNTTYVLFAQTRGVPRFSAEFDLNDPGRTVSIPKKIFPSGITTLTLFNANSLPVSERLIFINQNDGLKINITPSSSSSSKRRELTATINVNDSEGKPVSGNFSLAVIKDTKRSASGNILTGLLLTSDINGHIADPGFYFNGWNTKKEKLLDYVMMTNGWRRFNWSTVLLNQKLPVAFPVENGIEITGKITRQFFKLPLKDIKVTLTILNQYNDVFMTRSGEDGGFAFTGLDYPDTVGVKLEAAKPNGKKSLVIYVDQKETSRIKDMNYVTQQFLRKAGPEGRYPATEEIPEEEKDPFAEENNKIYRIHNEPEKQDVIIVDEHMQHYQNIAQIIQGRIPGVLVKGNSINIRGINSFYASTDPLFLVDGVVVDKDFALSMTPYDVDRIEVLKGPNAAIYGSRGANGVIAIYTKRGKFMLKGVLDFKMLGYHVPRTFYSPRYDIKRRDESFDDDRTTLYWKPFVITGKDGSARVKFYTSDIEGNYSIVVQGLSPNGTPGFASSSFEVK